MSQFAWPIAEKKVETVNAPQNRRFYGKMEFLTLWPSYIGEKGRLWAKHMGLKQGAIENTLWEHIGNLGNILGAHWELDGNNGKMKKYALWGYLQIHWKFSGRSLLFGKVPSKYTKRKLPQVLGQLIFSFQTQFFAFCLKFQQQIPLKNQYLSP